MITSFFVFDSSEFVSFGTVYLLAQSSDLFPRHHVPLQELRNGSLLEKDENITVS